MLSPEESREWIDNFSTVLIRRTDSERLKKLARPRKDRKPHQRRLEHKYEVITHALDLYEKVLAEEEKEA